MWYCQADIVNLLVKYYKEARRAIYLSNEETESRSNMNDGNNPMERAPVLKSMDAKSKTRAGGRCCICFDPLSIQGASVMVFFCCHAYHLHCLMDSTNSITSKKGSSGVASGNSYTNGDYMEDEEDENDQDTPSGGSRMRCVLCTTAAAGWFSLWMCCSFIYSWVW